MDMYGRLHMPGFVGETFEETGVMTKLEPADDRRPGENRKQRRAREAMERKIKEGQRA